MKSEGISRGVRSTASITEIEALLALARRGAQALAEAGVPLPGPQAAAGAAAIQSLEQGLADARRKRDEAAANRAYRREKPAPMPDDGRWLDVPNDLRGFAKRVDVVDVSRDPDRQLWQRIDGMALLPHQAEVRRQVWEVTLWLPGMHFLVAGHAATGDTAALQPLIDKLIHEATVTGRLAELRRFHFGEA